MTFSAPTILLADDSPPKIAVVRHQLRRAGVQWNVLEASTVQEALAIIAVHPIAYACIDYFIPVGNGPVIISALKQAWPQARMALFTSSRSPERWEQAMQAGAERCICSSDAPDEVENALEQLIHEWDTSA